MAIAVFALAASLIDPSQPAGAAAFVYAVLVGFGLHRWHFPGLTVAGTRAAVGGDNQPAGGSGECDNVDRNGVPRPQILREAVANAVRHGVSDIGQRAELDDSAVGLRISDNGRGLPEHGRFDERPCARDRIGPRSLRERIVSLGGSMAIDSTPAGVTLSTNLPLRNKDAADSDRSDRR